MGRPVHYDERVAHAVTLIQRLYEQEPLGGPLHVELDDWNIQGDTITPAYELPGFPDDYSTEVHTICDELAALLSGMPVEVRGSVLAHFEGFAVDGAVAEAWTRDPDAAEPALMVLRPSWWCDCGEEQRFDDRSQRNQSAVAHQRTTGHRVNTGNRVEQG